MRAFEQNIKEAGDQVVIGRSRRISGLIVVFALFAIFLSPGCIDYALNGGSHLTDPENVMIVGHVLKEGPLGRPIQGAIVSIENFDAVDTTDNRGRFQVSILCLAEELYFSVNRDGYQAYTDTIHINLDDSNHFTIIHKEIMLKRDAQ